MWECPGHCRPVVSSLTSDRLLLELNFVPYSKQRRDETPESREQKDGDCQHFYPHLRQRKWGSESCFPRHAASNRGNWDPDQSIYDLPIPMSFPRKGTPSPNHTPSLRNGAKLLGDSETLFLVLSNLSTPHYDPPTGHTWQTSASIPTSTKHHSFPVQREQNVWPRNSVVLH